MRATVANGAAKVPGFESFPLGDTKKFALGVGEIVIVDEAVALELVTDVAVIVTVLPEGTDAGAVYVVKAPLAVVDEPNEPHEPDGAQLQLTPPFAESLVTVAPTLLTAVTPIVCGGTGCSVTDSTGGTCVFVEPVPPPQPASAARQQPAKTWPIPRKSFFRQFGVTFVSCTTRILVKTLEAIVRLTPEIREGCGRKCRVRMADST